MPPEIERKFLLSALPDGVGERPGVEIFQGYLGNGGGSEIRLRRAGERTLLTVKTGAGEVREELEVEIDPALFAELWPLTEGRRIAKTRRREALGGGREAEIDEYAAELAGLLVAEVEFGTVEESQAFDPPSWLGPEVTGDRRYANRSLAVAGRPPAATQPSAYRLGRREPVGAGLVRILRGRADHAIEALREGAEQDPAAEIHTARKDVKKIRSVLRLLRDELGERSFRAENRRYRAAAAALSGSRDAEVKVATLEALAERFGPELPRASVWAWRRGLERERAAAADEAARSTSFAEAIAALTAGETTAAEWSLRGSWKLVGPGLVRGYERGRKLLGQVAADPDPDLVHEWRKRTKDVWYDLRLVRRAWPEVLDPTVASAHRLADLLGDHHDLTVLAADLAGREEVGGKLPLTGLIERRQAELLEEALELGARLYAEKPGAFGRRMHAYWSAWRAQ